LNDAAKIDRDPLVLILAPELALDDVEHHNNRASSVCQWLLCHGLLDLILGYIRLQQVALFSQCHISLSEM